MKRSLAPLSLLLAIACGSSEPSPGATTPASGEGKEDHHHKLTPELDAFHQLLAPLWHADKGEARRSKTCGAVPDFKMKAAAVKAAAAPASVEAATWSSAGAELEAAVTGLETACGGTDPAAFEPAFEAVHSRFHGAMELVASKHQQAPAPGPSKTESDTGGW